MGMAASQARFLGLTARKTNVEFQGQQINQARTSLANESANLYNEMLALKVPVPPSVSDYYNTSYKCTDDNKEFEITSGLGQEDCQAKITTTEYVTSSQKVNYGSPSTLTFSKDGKYLNGAPITILSGENNSTVSKTKIETILKDGVQLDKTSPFVMTNGSSALNVTNQAEYEEAVSAGYTLDDNSKYNQLYAYEKNGTFYYIQGIYIDETQGEMQSVNIPQEFFEKETKNYTYEAITNCKWGQDKSGRYTTLTGYLNGTMINYELEFEQVEDSIAYDQAMLEYKYEEAKYEKEIENINAKTAKIQEQDRGLELQLRQCDTEQEAISKELEAIKKVIQENVERVFKTFA